MEVKKLIGWRIRQVRQERGLTIEALAHQAKVTAPWLGELERGRQNVGVVVLDRLAKALKVEAWELLKPQESPKTKRPLREP
jgi:transcriptional regulator with XRE-family HTH domain